MANQNLGQQTNDRGPILVMKLNDLYLVKVMTENYVRNCIELR